MFTSLRFRIGLLLGVCAIAWLWGCTTGVEPSPQAGIVRVTLESNPADTSIIVIVDTLVISDQDSMDLTVFQGRVAVGDARFATLFPSLNSYRQEDVVYNILRRKSGSYVRYVIFESYVPPGSYDAVQFGMSATTLKFHYQPPITIEPPQDSLRFVTFRGLNFSVSENRVTEIDLQLDPLKSLTRYRDVYRMDFQHNVRLVGLQNY
jgi:hypothetical protein